MTAICTVQSDGKHEVWKKGLKKLFEGREVGHEKQIYCLRNIDFGTTNPIEIHRHTVDVYSNFVDAKNS